MSNILEVGRRIVMMGEFSLQVVVYATFQFILCLTLSHAAPRMASALISGQPGVSGQDIMHTMHSITHGMRTARGAVQSVGRAVHKAGDFGAGVTGFAKKGIQNARATNAAVNDAYGSRSGENEAYAKHLEKNNDGTLEKYATKVTDANGKEDWAKDKAGNIILNDEGKKAAKLFAQTNEGKKAVANYKKGRRAAVHKVNSERRKQEWSGLNYGEASLSARAGSGRYKENLSQKAKDMDLQKLWEKQRDKN